MTDNEQVATRVHDSTDAERIEALSSALLGLTQCCEGLVHTDDAGRYTVAPSGRANYSIDKELRIAREVLEDQD